MPLLRLHKFLADAGVASRRKCEEIIAAGRVAVNGITVTRPGTKVDPDKQAVTVDGRPVRIPERVCYILNKPRGVHCTSAKTPGVRRAIDLVPARGLRLYTVGRLDADSEGLIIITNDGELAQRIAHPRHRVDKEYEAEIDRAPAQDELAALRRGVRSEVGMLRFDGARVLRKTPRGVLLSITLHEGRNREIRRALDAVGLKVLALRRLRIGAISLGELAPGECRKPDARETAYLKSLLPAHR